MNPSNIIRKGEDAFWVTCAVCGAEVVGFERLSDKTNQGNIFFLLNDKQSPFVYRGITHIRKIPSQYEDAVINRLEEGKLSAIDQLLRDQCGFALGMDAYCIQCDRIYCAEHYRLNIIMADDHPCWYDYTEGCCPCGHSRIIHD